MILRMGSLLREMASEKAFAFAGLWLLWMLQKRMLRSRSGRQLCAAGHRDGRLI